MHTLPFHTKTYESCKWRSDSDHRKYLLNQKIKLFQRTAVFVTSDKRPNRF